MSRLRRVSRSRCGRSCGWTGTAVRNRSKGRRRARYGPPRVSPDGKRMATAILDQDRTNIWIWDFALETLRPLTSAPGMNGLPVWTLDSQRIIFMSDRTGVLNLYSQAADFTGTVVQITTSANTQWPTSITRDGEWIVGLRAMATDDLHRHRRVPADIPGRRVRSPVERAVSPSRLRTQSPRSGSKEAGPTSLRTVDTWRTSRTNLGGSRSTCGRFRRWVATAGRSRGRRDTRRVGTEWSRAVLPRRIGRAHWRAVSRPSGPRFVTGTPSRIFDTAYAEPNPARHYDVSPDGRRFLMLKDRAADPNATPASMVVVDHWFGGLHWQVPARGK